MAAVLTLDHPIFPLALRQKLSLLWLHPKYHSRTYQRFLLNPGFICLVGQSSVSVLPDTFVLCPMTNSGGMYHGSKPKIFFKDQVPYTCSETARNLGQGL